MSRRRDPLYGVWTEMLQRCRNPNNKNYSRYGGRGIAVCERWLSYENFRSDMAPRPPGMTLDRKDNDKGYDPENCRWISQAEQLLNRKNTVRIVYDGCETSVLEFCWKHNLPFRRTKDRMKMGWTAEQLIAGDGPLKSGANHPRCKLTRADADSIRAAASAGTKQAELASKYQVHPSAISLIVAGKIHGGANHV